MFSYLVRTYIPDAQNVSSPEVRRKYGTLCSVLGIVLNLLLFAGKLFAGLLAGSIAIMADAFNNLSDAGSSLITLVGFRLAGKKPDPDHPFGHGRMEYISGFVVSIAILLMGFELAKSSVQKLLHPEQPEFSFLVVGILVASIAVKLYMAAYNRTAAKAIDSAAMRATSLDSLSDSVATFVVLLSMLVQGIFHLNVDGACGLLVAIFILVAGYKAASETLSLLLGNPADPEFVDQIRQLVMKDSRILGIHDLVVHDYGPGRCMISLHAEVSSKEDLLEIHDLIDNLEKELAEELGCIATIHMDPVLVGDERTDRLRAKTLELVKEISPRLTIHDFRMVTGATHTNLIFDVVAPYDLGMSDEALSNEIKERLSKWEGTYFAVLTIDKNFTGADPV
ncbi:MAG: cation transporter [Clostridia bacterium]|nr:cation transporter [Clostridia bacterium]